MPGTPAADPEGDLRGYVLGLAEMYVADDRFAANYGGAKGAEFVRADGIHHGELNRGNPSLRRPGVRRSATDYIARYLTPGCDEPSRPDQPSGAILSIIAPKQINTFASTKSGLAYQRGGETHERNLTW